jgi:Peptidase A4 family
MKRLLSSFYALALVASLLAGTYVNHMIAARMDRLALIETVPHVVPTGNWSGYSLTGKFSEVHGTFTVPTIGRGGGALAEWVGVDGYDNSDLIQAGVSEQNGVDYAWWEILPSVSIPIWWMKVSPGDQITVGVRRYSGAQWIIDILDRATLQFFYQQFRYNGPAASVEWIVEAPTSLFSGQDPVLPYDGVQFSGLTYTGDAVSYHDCWMVQGGAVQSLPSTLPSTRELVAAGFSTEYVG